MNKCTNTSRKVKIKINIQCRTLILKNRSSSQMYRVNRVSRNQYRTIHIIADNTYSRQQNPYNVLYFQKYMLITQKIKLLNS